MTSVGEDREEQGEGRGGPGIRLNIGSLEAPDGSDNTEGFKREPTLDE
jgi:hypothetical protein